MSGCPQTRVFVRNSARSAPSFQTKLTSCKLQPHLCKLYRFRKPLSRLEQAWLKMFRLGESEKEPNLAKGLKLTS